MNVGDVIRFRWHHPNNSWMDRWGAGTIAVIEPDGRLKVDFGPGHSPGLAHYWMWAKVEEVYPDQHEIVEGVLFNVPACTVCGVALTSHAYPRRS
jgi:hypothetical protein